MRKRKCNYCGECGYFMRYKSTNGTKEKQGDCANLTMNKECNGNTIDPFLPWARDEGYTILQVDDNESGCRLFRVGRTPRVRRILKSYSEDYDS